jgi:hypothetical protein
METLAAPPFDGKADLPPLAQQLHMEVDDLFPIAEMLQLLRFAELFQGDIRLTKAGRRFAEAGTDERKAFIRQARRCTCAACCTDQTYSRRAPKPSRADASLQG